MSEPKWTYLKFVGDGDYAPGEKEKLPPENTAFLAFDALRWKVVIGFIERGGHTNILDPNANDDCNLVAFAPLATIKEPDEDIIKQYCPWKEATYSNPHCIKLLR